MTDVAEVKSLFDQLMAAQTALRSEHEALAGKAKDFVDDDRVKRIETEFAAKLAAAQKASEELKALQERFSAMEAKLGRGGAPGGGEGEAERKSFGLWLKGRPSDFEQKAMTADSNPDGGYLVPVAMRAGIAERLRRWSPVRSVANVVGIDGASYDLLVERGDSGFEWSGERSTRNETTTPTINRITINLHELSASPRASQRMIDDAGFDIEAWLTGHVVGRFARAEGAAFVSGDGVNKPMGFLSYPTAATADAARAAGTLERVGTGASGAFAADPDGAHVLIDVIHALQPAYRAGAVFMAKSTTAAALAKLQDSDGAYVLHSMMAADGGVVTRIKGYPLIEADDMPALGAGSLSIAFGNFGIGYTVVDSGGVRVLRDPYSAKPFVIFYVTKRTGGGVSDFDAIKLIQFS